MATQTVFLIDPAMNCRPTVGSPFRRRKANGGHGRDKDRIGPAGAGEAKSALVGCRLRLARLSAFFAMFVKAINRIKSLNRQNIKPIGFIRADQLDVNFPSGLFDRI
jgi:hypothetical protein